MMQLAPNARVLVINVSRIGDTLLLTPALRALKAALPEGELTVLAHPKRAEVLAHLPFIDRLATITPKSVWWKRWLLNRGPYDVALVYGEDVPLLRFARSVARYTVGTCQMDREAERYLDRVVDPAAPDSPAVDRGLALTDALGIPCDDRRLAYRVLPEEAVVADRWLEKRSLAGKTLIGLQVASFPTKPYRDWPTHRFAEMMDWMLTDDLDRRFVILGDHLSQPRAQELAARFPEAVTIAAGQFSLRQNAAVMSRLSLYVCVDTGPTHLAGALGLPMVALYHCMHPSSVYGPQDHPKAHLIDHPAVVGRCRPESDMADISVAPVYEAATELLRNPA